LILDHISWQDIKQKPDAGCYIYGVFIEGARWNAKTHKMDDPLPKELFSDLPLMHLQPIVNRDVPQTGIYNCPLYKVVSRAGTLSTTGKGGFLKFRSFDEFCDVYRASVGQGGKGVDSCRCCVVFGT
jgi:hypothetical protein